MNKKNILKAGIFIGLAVLIGYYLNLLLSPTWTSWNNDNTVKGFYEEPKNTIEVVFLGTSQYVNGISPIELYDKYGICAYDLATEQQPLLSSYYWLREAYKYQQDSLKVVCIEMSALNVHETADNSKMAFNEKALTHMKWSRNKLEALQACADQYGDDFKVMDYVLPFARYHSRWSEIGETDFEGVSEEKNYFFTRGQNVIFDMSMDNAIVANYGITETQDYTVEDYEKQWDENNVHYLDLIVDFCKDHDIQLVINQLPKSRWNDQAHDEVQYLADKYGVPFIDMNEVSIQDEMGIDFPHDDGGHPNYFGAKKYSDYLGKFFIENCGVSDVRNNLSYDYLKEQSEEYKKLQDDSRLKQCDNLREYIQLIDNDRYTVYVSARDDAAGALDDDTRKMLKDFGFSNLGDLEYRYSYVGVKDRGVVILDKAGSELGERFSVDGEVYEKARNVVNAVYPEHLDENGKLIETDTFKLLNGDGYFSIKSAGYSSGNTSSIVINGTEYSKAKRGLNFVVYDNDFKRVLDSCNFDTCAGLKRTTDVDPTGVYQRKVVNAKLSAALTIDDYIQEAEGENRTVLIMNCPVTGGKVQSSDILNKYDTSRIYVAVIRDDKVWKEAISNEKVELTGFANELVNYSLVVDSSKATLMIGESKYEAKPGFTGVCTYDRNANVVINYRTFDYNAESED